VRRDGSILAAVGGNENARDGVYGPGEEDWRNHDEEALYDEVSYCMNLVLQHLWVRNSPMKGWYYIRFERVLKM